MSNPILYVPAANCTKSPSNVRKKSNPIADAQLEANIEAKGVIQNLIGVPVARKKGHYRITGGGRRLDRVHNIIARGVFPADYAVPVMVMKSTDDAIETSLSENFFKLAMNPAEACRAFQDIIEIEKKFPADVAKRFGLTERFVLGRLRLANLAEPVFEALRDEEITIDVAMAYASTADTDRQARVFAQMAGGYYSGNIGEIRRLLANGSYKGGDPKALLVGRDAYTAAGGRVDSDLFSDSASEVWLDGTLLDRLVTEQLEAAAAAVRDREGFAEVRTIAAGHVPYSETYQLTPVTGNAAPLSPEAEIRKAEIESEVAAIEAAIDDADGDCERAERLAALEEELLSVTETVELISDEQRVGAIAYMVLGADGQPRLHEEFFLAPAGSGEETHDEEVEAEEGEPEEPADSDSGYRYSQRLADELAMMKTELLAVHVASDPHFALDLGIFFIVDSATRTFGSFDVPSEIRAQAPTPRVQGFESGMPAAERLTVLDKALDRSWTVSGVATDRYDGFRALADGDKKDWLAWAVARSLQAPVLGSKADGFNDHLGRKLEIDVAAAWRPTARTFFDRVPKAVILSLLEGVGTPELRDRYASLRKFDLAATAEKLFSGEILVEADVKERALSWIPSAMRFEKRDVSALAGVDHGDATSDSAPAEVTSAEGAEGGAAPISQAA